MPSLLSLILFLSVLSPIAIATLAHAKPLSDGISGSLGLVSEPGHLDLEGQQNFHPRFGLLAGYSRETYLSSNYSGWKLGGNFLLGRILSENWQASSVFTVGLAGMQADDHGHSAVWGRLNLDWENRRVLFGLLGETQRGLRMPGIDELQIRSGYSPLVSELNNIQPWFVISWYTRSGTGPAKVLAILRLLGGRWWVELGSSLSSTDRVLNFSISL